MSYTKDQANELLPMKPTEAITDPRRLKYLIIGPPKWGKTTFLCAVPDSILLATEEGHAFHKTYKIIIDSWDKQTIKERADSWGVDDDKNTHTTMVEAVDAICASDKFQFVIIDTADMAAKMCLDFHYQKFGVNHASDAGDYGKGWDISLTQPFRQVIGQLMKSGRGIGFITHTQVIEKRIGASVMSRAETTLPSQVQKFLHTQADLIIHGRFGKKRPGMPERDRIISLDGTNEILAGSRVRHITLPKKFIVDPDKPWEQWKGFFEDEELSQKADQQYIDLVLHGKEAEEVAAEPETATISATEPPDKPAVSKKATKRN